MNKLKTHKVDVSIAIDQFNKKNPSKKQLDQKLLAEKVGANKQVFSEWKKKAPKSIEILKKVSEVTGCNIDKMIVEKDE